MPRDLSEQPAHQEPPAHQAQHAPPAHQIAQATGPANAQPIGRVDTVTGSVTAQHTDGTTVTLHQGDSVYQKDLIATEAGAKVALVFADKTTFALGESGQLRLDDLVYNPAGKSGTMTVSMLKGAFAFVSGDIAGTQADAMTVRTPVGTIGIRGTAVVGDLAKGFFGAVPDPSGAPSIIVFTNGAGTQVITENLMIQVASFFAAPGTPLPITPGSLGEAGDLSFIAGAIAGAVNPGGSSPGGPAGGPSAPPPGAGAPGGEGGEPVIHVTVSDTGLGAGGSETFLFSISPPPPPPLDTTVPPPPPPPPHPHFDDETPPMSPPASPPPPPPPPAPSGFIGTAGQDNFQGHAGVTNFFDFVTNHNSLQSGDIVVGGGGNDTLNALFDRPFQINGTLTITNVPNISLQMGGGPSSLDAAGITGASTVVTVTGPGALTVTDLQVNFDGHALTDPLRVVAIASGLVIEGGQSHNTLIGTGDFLSYVHTGAGVTVDFTTGTADKGAGGALGTDSFTGFVGAIGSAFDDTFTTTDTTRFIAGGGGTDTVRIDGAHNTLTLVGIDHVTLSNVAASTTTVMLQGPPDGFTVDLGSTSTGSEALSVVGGNAGTITVGNGDDTVSVIGNSNVIDFGSGHDAIGVFGSNNVLNDGPGNDTISVIGNDDTLNLTGGGDDVISIVGANNFVDASVGGNDTIDVGGTGNVIVVGGAVGFVTLHGSNEHLTVTVLPSFSDDTLALTGNDDAVFLNAGDDTITINNSGAGNVVDLPGVNDDLMINSIARDASITVLVSDDFNISVTSGPGSETVAIVGNDDAIYTLSQNDTIFAIGNDDAIYMGPGPNSGPHTALIEMTGDDDLLYIGSDDTVTATMDGNGATINLFSPADDILNLPGNNELLTVSVNGGGFDDTINVSGNDDQIGFTGAIQSFVITISGHDDFVNFNSGDDTITISGTDDAVSLPGNDDQITLTGNSNLFVATITGSFGDDTLAIHGNDDVLTVNASDDTFFVGSTGTNDTFTVLGDDDLVTVTSSNESVGISFGFPGFGNVVSVQGDDDVVTVTANGQTLDDFLLINVAGGGDTINLMGSDDSITLLAASGNDSIGVFGHDDSIAGDNGSNTIYAHGGGDTITVGNGNDLIAAEFSHSLGGDDSIMAGAGNDTFTFYSSNNVATISITGSHGDDLISLSPNDAITFVGDDDVIRVIGAGGTAVTVNGGDDTVSLYENGGSVTFDNGNYSVNIASDAPGGSDDTISLNGGDDTVLVGGNGDVITFGNGVDTAGGVTMTGDDSTLNVTLQNSFATGAFSITGSDDALTIGLSNQPGDTLSLDASGSDDVFTVVGDDASIMISAGDETFTVNVTGDDTITVSGNVDTLRLNLGSGDDTLAAFHHIDVTGNDDSITLTGNFDDDSISLSGNDDTIRVSGNDMSAGCAGVTFTVSGLDDTIIVHGSDDRVNFTDNQSEALIVSGSDDTVLLGTGHDTITVSGNFDNVSFGAGGDLIAVSGDDDMLFDGAATNMYQVSGNDDTLDLSAGAFVTMTGSNHVLYLDLAAFSDDVLSVSGGNDTVVFAGVGDDTLNMQGNHEDAKINMIGANGDSLIVGSCNNGFDTVIVGGGFNDVITTANSASSGGHDSVTILGNGDDTLQVNANYDTIVAGGSGDDSIVVGGRDDMITVGDGNHTIVMNFNADTVIAGASCDDMITISGFHDLVSTDALTAAVSVASFASADTVVGGGAGSTFTLEGAGTITANNFGFIDVANGVNGTADITVSQFASSSSFDLSGDTSGHLTFDAIGPTTFSFYDLHGKPVTGTTLLHGVQTLTLEGGSYDLTFDRNFQSDTMTIDGSQLGAGNTLGFHDNSSNGFFADGNFDALPGAGADTLNGGYHDTLDYSQSPLPVTLTITDVVLGTASGTGAGGTAAGDVFTNFGNLHGSGAGDALVIASGSGVTAVDLSVGTITGPLGYTVSIAGFGEVIDQAGSITLSGDGASDTLIGGGGDDTLVQDSLGGGDNFGFLANTNSYSNAVAGADNHTDQIVNFADGSSTIDLTHLAGASTETFTGSKAFNTNFATTFAGDVANQVDYTFDGTNTFVHVSRGLGGGYSAGDLIVELQGNHTLTGANVHLHA